MPHEGTHKNIGLHWDKSISRAREQRTRWWQSPAIIRHINTLVCGQPVDGVNEGVIRLLKAQSQGRRFNKAISIGCGGGPQRT